MRLRVKLRFTGQDRLVTGNTIAHWAETDVGIDSMVDLTTLVAHIDSLHCAVVSPFGYWCDEPPGHDGPHRSELEW